MSQKIGRQYGTFKGVILLAVWLPLVGCTGPEEAVPSNELLIFGAASLADVVYALEDSFQVATGSAIQITSSVAASSVLARQIEHGALPDLFISAHADWVEYLEARNLVSRPFGFPFGNKLVLVSARNDASSGVLETLVRPGNLALADPSHVPAGLYARQALECMGLWDTVQDRMVPALDVRAALASTIQGATDRSIVYASDAFRLDEAWQVQPLPENCQPTILYTVARTKAEAPLADSLFMYLLSSEREKLWTSFGFIPNPGSTVSH